MAQMGIVIHNIIVEPVVLTAYLNSEKEENPIINA